MCPLEEVYNVIHRVLLQLTEALLVLCQPINENRCPKEMTGNKGRPRYILLIVVCNLYIIIYIIIYYFNHQKLSKILPMFPGPAPSSRSELRNVV